MSKDLNEMIKHHLKQQEILSKAAGVDLSEQIRSINEKLKGIQIPDTFKQLSQTMMQFSETMEKVSKTISTTNNLDRVDTTKVLQSVIAASTIGINTASSIKALTDFHVTLLKYLKTQMPEQIAIPVEDDDGVEYVTREQVEEMIAGLKVPVGMDTKFFLQYLYAPTINFIVILLTVVLHYAEFKDNASMIVHEVQAIIHEFQSHDNAPAIEIKPDQDNL